MSTFYGLPVHVTKMAPPDKVIILHATGWSAETLIVAPFDQFGSPGPLIPRHSLECRYSVGMREAAREVRRVRRGVRS